MILARRLRPFKRRWGVVLGGAVAGLGCAAFSAGLLDRLDNRGYDQLASTVSFKVRNFLSRYDRDSMDPVIWRLPILEPRLLKVAWKCLRGKPSSRKLPKRQSPSYLSEMD